VSETNVEIVRRSFETLGWTPAEVQARVARFYDPDADYYPVRKFPEARPCHGHARSCSSSSATTQLGVASSLRFEM
jgi:hypothetical protein